ncbi:MAG: hypothetical protein M3Z26_04905 [Bacteroidota bacterium]|nr:hypothetical protein [Bacteroidota bacterium]
MKNIVKYVSILFLSFSMHFANAQSPVLDVGIRLQQTVNLYNKNGISVSYSFKAIKPDRLYFGFSYVTSRLGTAFHSNAIKQDNYLVSAAWYIRRKHVIRPFLRLNTGYFSANYGNKIFDVLPRKSILLSSDIGICFQTNSPIKISTSIGYNFITGNGLSGTGTLYPVFYQFTLSWNLYNHIHHHQQNDRQKLKL